MNCKNGILEFKSWVFVQKEEWVCSMYGHCNGSYVYPRLLVVRESLCCDFLEWSHEWSIAHYKNATVVNYFKPAGHKIWGIFPFFLLWLWFLLFSPVPDSPNPRLHATPGVFHHIHVLPLKLVLLQLKGLFPQIIISSRTLPSTYNGIYHKEDSQSLFVQWMNSLAWALARSIKTFLKN